MSLWVTTGQALDRTAAAEATEAVMTSALLEVPRIYTSFAEFEREELRRLGLESMPARFDASSSRAVVAVAPVAKARSILRPAPRVTPASLRAEGILEIGGATGTSVLFVRTKVKLHLLHSTSLPDRQLDDYAVALAVTWIEGHGLPSCEVARNLGVNEITLRRAFAEAGYERCMLQRGDSLANARMRRIGNRRGRLVRASANAGA